jgi:hypothetical protein
MDSSPGSTAAEAVEPSLPHTAPGSCRYHTMWLRSYTATACSQLATAGTHT